MTKPVFQTVWMQFLGKRLPGLLDETGKGCVWVAFQDESLVPYPSLYVTTEHRDVWEDVDEIFRRLVKHDNFYLRDGIWTLKSDAKVNLLGNHGRPKFNSAAMPLAASASY